MLTQALNTFGFIKAFLNYIPEKLNNFLHIFSLTRGLIFLKFLCDVMLGKLGRWLRMMGHDTEIASDDLEDRELINRAEEEERTIITRDLDLKKMNSSIDVFLLDRKEFESQIKEVFSFFDLKTYFPDGSRCSHCNGELKKLSNNEWICKRCNHKYWKGSHWRRIREIQRMLNGL